MSHSNDDQKKLVTESIVNDLPTDYSNEQLLKPGSGGSFAHTLEPKVSSRQAEQSCFRSTVIFSINFVSSILVINLSKWIYVRHHFPNLTLTTINFFSSFLLLYVCLQVKLFTHVRLPIVKMIPVSICFAGFIAFSNLSLEHNTVGTYQLIKLQVTPTVMLISGLYFKSHYPVPIILSFLPIFIGTLITTYYDLNFNIFGLFCASTSVMFTAVYQVLVEHYQKEYDCNSLQLLLYQAPLSGLFLLVFVPFFEPLNDLERFLNVEIITLVALCGIVAFAVNLSVFWVIGNLSAVAYNMIGHTKTLLIISIGSVVFNEPFNSRQGFGLAFTMLGVFNVFVFEVRWESNEMILITRSCSTISFTGCQ